MRIKKPYVPYRPSRRSRPAHRSGVRRARGQSHRTFACCVLLVVLAKGAFAATEEAHRQAWDVTFAIRVEGGVGDEGELRLALPMPRPGLDVGEIEVDKRGMETTLELDATPPRVSMRGKVDGARRLAVHYRIETTASAVVVPRVEPIEMPTEDLLPHLAPSPLFQSRSILVREFLETHVAPLIQGTSTDLLRLIFAQTRNHLRWQSKGKTLTLDVIRSGGGRRIGIERAFTTFLRCARIPARLVEGINLRSRARRKRVFWTEVWSDGEWWPVSASRGWMGQIPASYVPLTLDGARVLEVEAPLGGSYRVQTKRVTE